MIHELRHLRELLRQLEIMEAKTNARFVRDLASLHGTEPVVEAVGDSAWILHDNGPSGPFRGLQGNATPEELGTEMVAGVLSRLRELDDAQILLNPAVNGSLAAFALDEGWTIGEIHLAYLYDLDEISTLPLPPGGIEIVGQEDMGEGEMLAAAARCHLNLERDPREEELRIGRAFAMNPEIHSFVALAEGQIAGTAFVHGEGDLASLRGACTAPQFRRKGVQRALILARLEWARDRGHRYGFLGSPLGGATARNAERLGFMLGGTRVFLRRAPGEVKAGR